MWRPFPISMDIQANATHSNTNSHPPCRPVPVHGSFHSLTCAVLTCVPGTGVVKSSFTSTRVTVEGGSHGLAGTTDLRTTHIHQYYISKVTNMHVCLNRAQFEVLTETSEDLIKDVALLIGGIFPKYKWTLTCASLLEISAHGLSKLKEKKIMVWCSSWWEHPEGTTSQEANVVRTMTMHF